MKSNHSLTTYTPDSDEDGNSEGIDEHKQFHNKLSGNLIPLELQPLLTLSHMQSKISLQARFKCQGIIFATNHTHRGNSQIYPGGNTNLAPVPGFIEYIYTEQAMPNNISFAIQTAIPNNNDIPNPFSRYKHWPVRQYLCAQLSCVQVHPEWTYSQFAQWNCDCETMVIVLLNQVCLCTVSKIFSRCV